MGRRPCGEWSRRRRRRRRAGRARVAAREGRKRPVKVISRSTHMRFFSRDDLGDGDGRGDGVVWCGRVFRGGRRIGT